MTGIMKAQIDWIPLNIGSVRPTQGKTLAVMEVSGGSQSFNAVNQLRMEELIKFTLLTRDVSPYLVDRYSERRESAEELSKRVNLRSIQNCFRAIISTTADARFWPIGDPRLHRICGAAVRLLLLTDASKAMSPLKAENGRL
jgi:NAD(P)H-dependent FMN reductase